MHSADRTAWGKLLIFHRERQRMTGDDLSRIVGVAQRTISDYEMGVLRPPLAKLTDFCDALDIHTDERLRFIEEAYLAHAPDRVRAMVVDLRNRVRRLERLAGFQPGDPNSKVG
jgi:transcriptional regulator with XRE-family HTH domain